MEYLSKNHLIDEANRRVRSLREGKAFWGFAFAFLVGVGVVSDNSVAVVLVLPSLWFWHSLGEAADGMAKAVELLMQAEGEEEERISQRLGYSIKMSFFDIVRGVF